MHLRSALRRRLAGALPLGLVAAIAAVVPVVAGVSAPPAVAQDAPFPSRTVRIVTGSAAGGSIDGIARLLAERLSGRWGQPVVVENKPGASQTIAVDSVAKARPDGYTLLISTSSPMIQVKFTQKNLPYDVQRDFTALSVVGVGSIALVARHDAPFDDIAGLKAHARGQGKGLPYGSWGNGGGAHLVGEGLRARAGIDLVHVPYKGGEAAELNDLIGGSLAVTFLTQATAKVQADAGKVKVLAVTGPQRDPSLPKVPTFREQGIEGLEVIGWIGAFAPAGTPAALLDKVSADMRAVLTDPDVSARMRTLGFESGGGTPDAFARLFREDEARWKALADIAGLKPE